MTDEEIKNRIAEVEWKAAHSKKRAIKKVAQEKQIERPPDPVVSEVKEIPRDEVTNGAATWCLFLCAVGALWSWAEGNLVLAGTSVVLGLFYAKIFFTKQTTAR